MNNDFIKELFDLLCNNKRYPKYQLERRIDIFIHIFLKSILKHSLDIKVDFLIPEFPLKKRENAKSTNVDYLGYSKLENTVYLIELKTDNNSYSKSQIDRYLGAMERGWVNIVSDLTVIYRHTEKRFKPKYQYLLDTVGEIKNDTRLRLLYIGPEEMHCKLKKDKFTDLEKFQFLSFEKIKSLQAIDSYPEEWELVKTKLLDYL